MRPPEVVVVDLEWVGPATDPANLRMAGFLYPDGTVAQLSGEQAVTSYAATPWHLPVVSHMHVDSTYLGRLGLPISDTIYDTRVMAAVLNENQDLTLKVLVKKYLGNEMDKSGQKQVATMSWEDLAEYNRKDLLNTRLLFYALWDHLARTAWLEYYLREEVPFTRVLVQMEVAGLPVLGDCKGDKSVCDAA